MFEMLRDLTFVTSISYSKSQHTKFHFYVFNDFPRSPGPGLQVPVQGNRYKIQAILPFSASRCILISYLSSILAYINLVQDLPWSDLARHVDYLKEIG